MAGFLSFLLGPAIGGAVFGFFLGMLVGLFEDLSIFLHIHEIIGAITQLPKMIGDLVGNPSMLMAMFVDMITAHLTRCMLVNPFGTPSGTPDQWAGWVAKRFFGEEPDPEADGMGNAIVFSVACTVLSVTGWLAQSSIVKSGTMKFVRHTMEDAAMPGSSLLVLRVVPPWPSNGQHQLPPSLVISCRMRPSQRVFRVKSEKLREKSVLTARLNPDFGGAATLKG